MKSSSRREAILAVLCILLLGVVVLSLNLPWSPAFQGLGADSGLYAYVGSAIVHGQVLYRDAWEQKPPIGFYLDALAVLVFGQTPWAIWWFSLIWVAGTGAAFLLVMRKMVGWIAALLASLVFILGVMNPEVYQGGNLMEIYGLLPQVLTIAAAYAFFTSREDRWVFLAGLLTGLAFMTKQTTIGLGLASLVTILGMTLLGREFKSMWRRALGFGAGFLIPPGIGALYWLLLGALDEFLAATVLFGLSYVGEGAPFFWSVKNTVLGVFPKMFISKIYWIAALAFLPFIGLNFKKIVRSIARDPKRVAVAPAEALPPVETTMLAVFLALPLELVFASLGGRNFGHYFISLVPAVAAIVAYIVWKLVPGLQGLSRKSGGLAWWLAAGWILLGAGALVWSSAALRLDFPTRNQWTGFPAAFGRRYSMNELERYVADHTGPDDPVLVWHIHVGLNFVTDRRPPQRILFPAMLFIPADRAGDNLDEFLGQLEQSPPRLILVQENSSIGLPFVDVPVEEMCPGGACIPGLAEAIQRPDVYADLVRFRQYFLDHYTRDTQIDDWIIYRLVR